MTWPAGLQYHQKSALLHNIADQIRLAGAQSLLDIGAGRPSMALPLSKHVRRYCAIEASAECVDELRRATLDTIHGRFPVPMDETYDFVLASHSLPQHSIEDCSHFLTAAWECTAEDGTMLIVTFKGNKGPIETLRSELLGGPSQPDREFDGIVERCQSMGTTHIKPVNSFIEAHSAADIAEFIAPWLSGHQSMRDDF
jgi:cyclopropane fatty-acyl-phospholipid synthase-like methyltransferase